MKNLLILLSLLFITNFTFAQKSIIRGTVMDEVNDEPLLGATVMIVGTNQGTITGIDAEYALEVEPGVYDLQFSFISYKTVRLNGVVVGTNQVKVIDRVKLSEDLLEVGEVLVLAEAIRSNETGIINLKSKSVSMIDGISADKLKQTGDGNVAEATKRVTGVTVENGKYVFVRGLGDRYSKTILNGVDIPGLDPDKNTIQMDIFPTNLINNIIVSKTFTAELPADFTGGLIDIETKDFPDKKFSNFSFNTTFNPQVHFNKNFLDYKGGKTDFLGFDDGTRSLPDGSRNSITPTPYQGFSQEQISNFITSFSPTLATRRNLSLMDFGFSFSAGNQIELKNKSKLGYSFGITYKSDYKFFNEVTFGEYQRFSDPLNLELNQSTLQTGELGERNRLLGLIGGLTIKNNKSKIKLSLIHIQNGESRAGKFYIQNNAQAVGQSGYEASSDNLEYNQRSFSNILINGTHVFNKSGWDIDWKISPTLSSSIDPDIRKTAFSHSGQFRFSPGEAGNPSRIWRNLSEINAVAKVDISKSIKLFGSESKLKFGTSHTFKSRDYSILLFEILFDRPQLWVSPDANLVLDPSNVYSNPNNGSYIQSGNSNPNSNSYSSNINNTGFYSSYEVTFIKKLKVVLGFRGEYFIQRHTGRDIQFAGGDIYGNNLINQKVLETFNLFPSVNIAYNLTKKQNLRFSYSKTVARPSFKELSFAQILDPITNRIFNGSLFTYSKIVEGQRIFSWDGNLKETDINNIDLRWEKFIKQNQLLSFSGFFKNFENPIELVRIPEQQTSTELQARNVGRGRVFGFEFEIRKNLEFISSKLSKIMFNTNVTLVKSEIKMSDIEYNARLNYIRDGESIKRNRDMAGQSPYVINTGLSYNNEDIGLDIGIFYNVKGSTLSIVGTGLSPDIYDEPFHSLNFSAIKKLGKNNQTAIDFKINNLLNERVESFYKSYKSQKQIFNSINPGISFSFGLSHKF